MSDGRLNFKVGRIASHTCHPRKQTMSLRHWKTHATAALQGRHWRALFNILRKARQPGDFLRRYLQGKGEYPATIDIRRDSSLVPVTVWSWHDVLTINEIFFREDYPVPTGSKVVVDLGSNIGISVLYFLLETGPDGLVYAYEPVPENLEKLRLNLRGYEGRFRLTPHAIGPAGGKASFGVEKTGRYGGLGLPGEKNIEVDVLDVNAEIRRILKRHERIDLLKIDIESLELDLLRAIDRDSLRKIRRIHLELNGELDFAADGFAVSRRGLIYTLKNTWLS